MYSVHLFLKCTVHWAFYCFILCNIQVDRQNNNVCSKTYSCDIKAHSFEKCLWPSCSLYICRRLLVKLMQNRQCLLISKADQLPVAETGQTFLGNCCRCLLDKLVCWFCSGCDVKWSSDALWSFQRINLSNQQITLSDLSVSLTLISKP